MRNLRWLVAGAAWLASSACLAPPVASVETKVIQQTAIRVAQNEMNQVDILFLVDNSPSMDAMQTELKSKFGQFLSVFQDLANDGVYADLDIGVVTSDYGAGMEDNRSTDVNGVVTGCAATPGQGGILQTTAAPHQPNTGCAGPVGARFLHYVFGPDQPRSNLPPGASLTDTFTCMASVGANGCGFEMQLEAVYAALTNTKENAGFLRDGALLAVVFVTNEDDGSAPPTAHVYDSDSKYVSMFGAYDTYRQTRFGIGCGNPLAAPPYAVTPMPLVGCAPAPNDSVSMLGLEYDVSRYRTLLLSPKSMHGIKDNPETDVILVGLDAPVTPFEIVEVDPTTGKGEGSQPTYQPCKPGTSVGTGSCMYRLQHSCQNTVAPAFFGDPAVRLNSVIGAAKLNTIASICGDDPKAEPDYSQTLRGVAKMITQEIGPGCIPAPLTSRDRPDCVVEDVTTLTDGTTHEQQLLQCKLDGNGMPLASNEFPCWAVQTKQACKMQSPESVGITIFRNGLAPPPMTNARVECSTIATAPR